MSAYPGIQPSPYQQPVASPLVAPAPIQAGSNGVYAPPPPPPAQYTAQAPGYVAPPQQAQTQPQIVAQPQVQPAPMVYPYPPVNPTPEKAQASAQVDTVQTATGFTVAIGSSPATLMTGDVEAQIAVSQKARNLRSQVTARVYGALGIMLAITAVVCGIMYGATENVSVDTLATVSVITLVVGLVLYIGFAIAIECVSQKMSSGCAITMMICVSLSMGLFMGSLVILVDVESLVTAAVGTCLATLGCTGLGFCIRRDVSIWIFLLAVIILAQLTWLLYPLMFIWGRVYYDYQFSYAISCTIAMIFVVIIGIYLVIDTYYVTKHLPPARWLAGATKIYSDVCYIFMYILLLCGNSR